VWELLRDDPELLALAEVIASLRPEDIPGQAGERRRHRIGRVLSAFVSWWRGLGRRGSV
jgi:hypothetical protein